MIKIRNLLIKIRYVGTSYHGFQIQKNAVTIQEVFQKSLNTVLGYLPDIKGCSRTDSGVHAYEYALSTKIESSIPERKLMTALNHYLPKDVSVMSIVEVDEDFHARYSCLAKQYRYQIYNESVMDPFLLGKALQIKRNIDCELLGEAALHFVGTNDFRPFSGNNNPDDNTVRTVYRFSVSRKGSLVSFLVVADGFLYNMVRIMVGVLLEINDNRLQIEDIDRIFEGNTRTKRCITVPPVGLYLDRVFYSLGELDE